MAVLLAVWPAAASSTQEARPEVPVTATDVATTLRANNSPVLAVDRGDPRFVAVANRLDNPIGCALHLSGDGGRSWVPANPVPKLPAGAKRCHAPEVVIDGKGVLYFLFVGLGGLPNRPVGAYLVTSGDRGRSFSAPRRVLGPQAFMVRMAIDRDRGAKGRLHLVWVQAGSPAPPAGLPAGPNPVMAAFSDDGGGHFSAPVQVSDADRRRAVAPALAVGRDHAVHVAYYDLADDDRDYQGLPGPPWEQKWSLVVATSADGGRRFGRGVVVDADIVAPGRVAPVYTMAPAALIAGSGSALWVAWTDARHGDWDVLARRSGNAGRSWAPPQRVNDDALNSGAHQHLPALSVSPGGRVDMVFFDRRNDPANLTYDVYLASSRGGLDRFAANYRLSSRPSSSRIGPRYAIDPERAELGSSTAVVSLPALAVAAWTDTRNAIASPQQDIFATELALPADPGSPRRWLPALAIALVLGAMVVVALGRRAKRRVASGHRDSTASAPASPGCGGTSASADPKECNFVH